LVERNGPLPRTYTVSTGGGGTHYYYRIDGQSYDIPKLIAPGVELLRNGYVIAPPSDTRKASSGGGLYQVIDYNRDEFSSLPIKWLEEVFTKSWYRDVEKNLPRTEDWVLEKGERNEKITQMMGLLRRYGFNAGELERWVKSWDPERVEDFEEVLDELPTIARSVERYPPEVIHPNQISLNIRPRTKAPVLEDAAYHGPIGKWVRYIAERSEAHPAALLMQALAIFGNRIGAESIEDAAPGFRQGESYHRTALYIMVIGESGRGAKGDSWSYAHSLLRRVDPTFIPHEGVQTGEGFIEVLADDEPLDERSTINGNKVRHVKKGGQHDRRYFNFEPEYGRVLHVASRPGSTIKDIVRALWDYGSTEKVTAASRHKVTGVTLSMVCHITPPEMSRDFDEIDLMSGYGNRFLFCWSERTKSLSKERPLDKSVWPRFVNPLKEALEFAFEEAPEDYIFSSTADLLWEDEIENWKKQYHPSSMVTALKSRFRPQVRRLAVIYAVADCSEYIEVEHLKAAMAVWNYSVQTVERCLSQQTGDKDADKLFTALLEHPSGLTRRQVTMEVFKGNKSAAQIDHIASRLRERKLLIEKKVKGKSKPTIYWIAKRNDW
jgi:hypothetical protein